MIGPSCELQLTPFRISVCVWCKCITKTRLFKYTEIFITKKWKFSDKKLRHVSYFCSKHRLWVLVRTAYEAVLTSTHILCFWAEITILMYTPVNPSFTIEKWVLRGSNLYRHVFVMLLLVHLNRQYFLFWQWKSAISVYTPVYEPYQEKNSISNTRAVWFQISSHIAIKTSNQALQ